MTIQNPGMSSRLPDLANGNLSVGLPGGSSAPATPDVVRKYYERKYGDKGSTSNLLATASGNNSSLSSYSNPSSFDAGQSSSSSLPVRSNGTLPGKGPTTTTTATTTTTSAAAGTRNSNTFNLRNKLPDSIQNTIAMTSQSLQSKLPASLQKLPASLTQGPTLNMLASKFQNAFS